MESKDDYEYVVAIKEAPTYMGSSVLLNGIRILCGPCSWNEAVMFIKEAVKDGALEEHYHLFTRKIEEWKECTW